MTLRLPRWELLVLVALFAGFSVLALFFPTSGDDWAWGSSIGTDRLHTWFAGYNGRYAGNLVVLALTRAGWLAPFVLGAVVTFSLWCVLELAAARTRAGYAWATALFLLMPLGTWRESIAWLSGFCNYGVGSACLLAALVLLRNDWRRDARAVSPLAAVAIGVLGFVGSLFIEHVTLAVLALAGMSLLARLYVARRLPARGTPLLVGSVVGTATMLSNSAYGFVGTPTEAYIAQNRTIGGDKVPLWSQVADLISYDAVAVNVVLNTVIAVCVVLLARRSAAPAAARLTASALALALMVCSIGQSALTMDGRLPSAHVRELAIVSLLLLLATLVFTAWRIVTPADDRARVAVTAVLVVLLVAPLTIVQPVGPRCFYPTYVVMLVVALTLLRLTGATVDRWSSPRTLLPLAAVLALAAAYLVVYASIHAAQATRLATLQAAVRHHRHEVVVQPLPHREFVHDGDPYWSLLEQRMLLFYGLPSDLVIHLPERGDARLQARDEEWGDWPWPKQRSTVAPD